MASRPTESLPDHDRDFQSEIPPFSFLRQHRRLQSILSLGGTDQRARSFSTDLALFDPLRSAGCPEGIVEEVKHHLFTQYEAGGYRVVGPESDDELQREGERYREALELPDADPVRLAFNLFLHVRGFRYGERIPFGSGADLPF